MISKILFCILFSFIFISEIRATQVQTCTDLPKFKFVNIHGCDIEPCNLYDGSDAIMELTFDVHKYSAKLKPKVVVTLESGISFPYPLVTDGCSGLINGYCPVYEGEVLLYIFSMPIKGYPEIPFSMEFKMQTDDDTVLACFKVKLRTVKP